MSELKNGPLPNNDNNANGPPEPAGVLWIKNNFSPNLPRIPGVSRLIYLNVSSFLSGFMLSFSYEHHVRLIIAPRDREVSSLFFMGKYSFLSKYTFAGWIEMLSKQLVHY